MVQIPTWHLAELSESATLLRSHPSFPHCTESTTAHPQEAAGTAAVFSPAAAFAKLSSMSLVAEADESPQAGGGGGGGFWGPF